MGVVGAATEGTAQGVKTGFKWGLLGFAAVILLGALATFWLPFVVAGVVGGAVAGLGGVFASGLVSGAASVLAWAATFVVGASATSVLGGGTATVVGGLSTILGAIKGFAKGV
jgi:hypothetical protein